LQITSYKYDSYNTERYVKTELGTFIPLYICTKNKYIFECIYKT